MAFEVFYIESARNTVQYFLSRKVTCAGKVSHNEYIFKNE